MKGYESIDEMSLKDCFEFLHSEDVNNPMYDAISIRFQNLLDDLCKQDETDFAACKTSEDYDSYINKYTDKSIALYYEAKHLEEAKINSEDSFWKSNNNTVRGCRKYLSRYPQGRYKTEAYNKIRHSKRTKWLIIGIIVTILVITFFAGYRPVNRLSANKDNIIIGKWGGTTKINVTTNVSPEAIAFGVSGDGFTIEQDNYSCKVSAEPNEEDMLNETLYVYAYSTLYGERIGKGKCLSIKLSQESGLPTKEPYVSIANIDSISKWGNTYQFTVETDAVKLDIESQNNDWASVKEIERNKENGIYKYNIIVEKNPYDYRKGRVDIKTVSCNKVITLSQNSGLAHSFEVSEYNITARQEGSGEGKHYPIQVLTDGTTWSIKNQPQWEELNTEVILSSGILSVKLGPNPGKTREGTITLMSNNGHERDITIKQWGKWETCSNCNGDGYTKCQRCKGNKKIRCDNTSAGMYFDTYNNARHSYLGFPYIRLCERCNGSFWIQCPNCDGNGQFRCSICDGKGQVR